MSDNPETTNICPDCGFEHKLADEIMGKKETTTRGPNGRPLHTTKRGIEEMPKTTKPHIHVCIGTNLKFVVVGLSKGCRKPIILSSHRSYQVAAERAGRRFSFGQFKRIWVNMIADYYDPVTLLQVVRP